MNNFYMPPSGAVSSVQTHNYDHSLQDPILRDVLSSVKFVPDFDKKKSVMNFINEITQCQILENNAISLQYLNMLISGWGTNSNIDSTNGVSCDDLLYICSLEWNIIKDRLEMQVSQIFKPIDSEILIDFARNFFIQLMDVQTGTCQQGRVIRIWQIAYSYAIFL
jgi:hypothetical protein